MSLAPLRSKLSLNPSSLILHNSIMKNPGSARMSPAPTTLGLNRGWQWAICFPVIITGVLWLFTFNAPPPFDTFPGLSRHFAISLETPDWSLSFQHDRHILRSHIPRQNFQIPNIRRSSGEKGILHPQPPASTTFASSLDINDSSEPMRIGQLNVFGKLQTLRRAKSPGSASLLLKSSRPDHRGFCFSPLIVDEDPGVMMGSKAYEVVVKRSLKQDYMTDRAEVRLTGKLVGEVVGVLDDNVLVLVKVEDWFVESDVFKMGRWREIVESLKEADEVRVEVAVPA